MRTAAMPVQRPGKDSRRIAGTAALILVKKWTPSPWSQAVRLAALACPRRRQPDLAWPSRIGCPKVREGPKKSPPKRTFFQITRVRTDSGNLDFLSLQAFLALGDYERDALTFLQGLEARALDRAKMHEQVITAFRGDEAKTLGVVEPLDCTALTIRHVTLPLKLVMVCGPCALHLAAKGAANRE
jgi:hypothetical protein